MTFDRRAVVALAAAGMLWGSTVPATKLAVLWLSPGWLTVARFGLAAVILLVACRSRLRAACSPAVLAWGAAGYGGTILVQNEGVMRTSVSHAALLVGATPVLVAIIAALRFRSIARPAAWAGYAVSLGGVCLVAGAAGGSATMTGDGLILVSLLLSASFTVAQPRVLDGRDPLAVTALQFLAATVAALPVAVLTEGMPPVAGASRGLLVTVALALGGTLLPFALFAFAQSRVSAATAAPFLNLEPLVGAAAGVVAFGDPFGLPQIAGAAAIVAGIAVSSVPLTGLLGLAGLARLAGLGALRPAGRSGHEKHPAEPAPVLQQRVRLGRLLEWEGRLDGSTQAAERGQQLHARGSDLTANAVQDDVDAVRSGRADLLRPVGIGVADAHVSAVLPGEFELARRAGRHQCDYPLAHDCRADIPARRLHGADDVAVRAARQRRLAERADAAAHGGVDVTGPDGLRRDQDLAGPGHGDLGLLDPQDVRAAELVVTHSPHLVALSRRRFDWPSQRWADKRCSCQRWPGQRYQQPLALPTNLARLAA